MPDYVPPGAPAVGTTCIIPALLTDLAETADIQARTVVGTRTLTGLDRAEAAVPGAQLINGCIALRQTAEPLAVELYEVLSQLSQKVRSGITTLSDVDSANADAICRVNDR